MALVVSNVWSQNAASQDKTSALGNYSPTWQETISAYNKLASETKNTALFEIGMSDVGRPIHAFVLSQNADDIFNLRELTELRESNQNRACLLINNAIHPGEPCGVNASLSWLESLMSDTKKRNRLLAKMDVVVIPMYNVGGALNRNCCSRTNQNGPEEYGFRGNARNLDLNRDFIKMDSHNAHAFVQLFHAIDPDVFIDTHTSNGADYPYAMTLITTQTDKIGPVLGPFLEDIMVPHVFESMRQMGQDIVPYVNTRNQTPESGIIGFLESPRYSTGYTALFGTLGFTSEAHMLKPFPVRVAATIKLIDCIANFSMEHAEEILNIRNAEQERLENAVKLPVHWKLNLKDSTLISFRGYEARREVSQVTGDIRLRYDHETTWEQDIPYFNHYQSDEFASVPDFYIIPQAWREVVERCKWNGVQMSALSSDTIMEVEVTYIRGFDPMSLPYEGHHVNRLDSIDFRIEPVRLYKGDWIVTTNQESVRYLVETLDPRGHDSFFAWNFFDSALQQKEYFSGYVFEETALEMLQSDDELKQRFELEKQRNDELEDNSRAQLNWLYLNSVHYEGTVNRYPIFQSITKKQ
jgi:hypothetical protein